jgi:hypothetical protein
VLKTPLWKKAWRVAGRFFHDRAAEIRISGFIPPAGAKMIPVA